MKSNLLINDSLFKVLCKFEMLISEMTSYQTLKTVCVSFCTHSIIKLNFKVHEHLKIAEKLKKNILKGYESDIHDVVPHEATLLLIKLLFWGN